MQDDDDEEDMGRDFGSKRDLSYDSDEKEDNADAELISLDS